MNSIIRTAIPKRRSGLVAILLLAISLSVTAQTATAPAPQAPYSAAAEHARAIAKGWLARGIPGLSIAVAIDGKVVYSEGFGFADLEQRIPVSPSTRFRIGSISKPLTAVGLVLLVEQGKVDLDAPVQKYVPSFPDKGALITARLLAGHLAGIRHYKDDEFEISRHYSNVLDGLKIFADDPLVSPPGTKFNYSSYGFNLLSAVIQSASGDEFLRYMQGHVFGPLDLGNTVPDQNADIVTHRSRFYELEKDGAVKNAPYVDNSYKWAGGGFLSTTEDLVHFGSALLRPGFLKPESLALLFTSQRTKDGAETGYGIGWHVGKSPSGKRVFEHAGGSVGGTSQLILYPDSGLVIAMANDLSSAPWKIEEVEDIAEAFEKK